MKEVLIDTNLRTSEQFERLCERLDADGEAAYDRCFLHLVIWFLRWGGDSALDSGLFFGVTEKRLGMWAEYDNPLRFGRALVEAGFVVDLASLYPAELLGGRVGFCVRGSLDRTWDGVHRHRGTERALLCPFLVDAEKRSRAAAVLGLDATKYPKDWILPCVDRGGQHSGQHSAQRGGLPNPPPLPPRVREENQEIKQREQGRTGKPKSPELRAFIELNKYSDPRSCLYEMDDGFKAREVWESALGRDVEFVRTVLSELVETDASWDAIRTVPAAVVMARLQAMGKRARWTRRGGSGGGLGRQGSSGGQNAA